jgi:hypothetical protein
MEMKTWPNRKVRRLALLALVATVVTTLLVVWLSTPAPESKSHSDYPLGTADAAATTVPAKEKEESAPPLCPGEDTDRQGYNEPNGNNDSWGYKYPSVVVTPTYTCIGWIHWEPQAGENGLPDVDYVHFRTVEADIGRTLVAHLTDLPKDYSLTYIAPLNQDRGFITDRGTQDKVLEFSVEYTGVYAIKVVSRSYPPDFDPPKHDPDEPYLLTLEWKDGH